MATSKKKTVKKKTTNKTVVKKNTVTKKKTNTKKKLSFKERQKLVELRKKHIRNSLIILILLFIMFIFSVLVYYLAFTTPTLSIKSVYVADNQAIIKYKRSNLNYKSKVYCLYTTSDKVPSIDDERWFVSFGNTCTYLLDENIYSAYLKNEKGVIYKVRQTNRLGKVLNVKINKEKDYIPLNGKVELKLTYDKLGYVEDIINWKSSNHLVATVSDGLVTAKSLGTTTISACIKSECVESVITVTNKIVNRPKTFDLSKAYLGCNKYTKEDNELLDDILKTKIENAGYKTRAGVVEAARFLTLDFPYRINYFYENGRQTTNKVDGEGRYYHVGLYLEKSKYSTIKGSKKGPKTWGCDLYSTPAKRTIVNGLDCSGFVSWALLNGGFDVKDVGAGWSDKLDLTDYGTVKKVNSSVVKSIKVGDLLHSTRAGGHIGIIVGMDNNNFYIAQALWYKPIGVIITKRSKTTLASEFPHVVLMDKYYKEDGNLTNMW